MKNGQKTTPLPLMKMAERSETFQRRSLEFLSERMRNEEWRETDPPPSHDNVEKNKVILENFSRLSVIENEECRMETN